MVKKRVAKRRPAAKRRKAAPAKGVEFSTVRKAAEQKIKELKRLEQTPDVAAAIGRMEECIAQVSQICGHNMLFPI
jgi:hypothetical protein